MTSSVQKPYTTSEEVRLAVNNKENPIFAYYEGATEEGWGTAEAYLIGFGYKPEKLDNTEDLLRHWSSLFC